MLGRFHFFLLDIVRLIAFVEDNFIRLGMVAYGFRIQAPSSTFLPFSVGMRIISLILPIFPKIEFMFLLDMPPFQVGALSSSTLAAIEQCIDLALAGR
ncbi:hypothetical protein AXF42_Ash011010 [Apostasia shenzhenica]|uniref:Uncharacterized protein n=1 Tax=Apostasia shenzhenica TaxID=1088818 RepID=A0A2H9ZQV2_9ASPA|nr:hypothetical protein AXF42_Ash011010 [Apostasia shenzhenica]